MCKCKVIAIANQKGGDGKTTTTLNIGVGLANLGKKVLLIDADAQANLTVSLGFNRPDMLSYTTGQAMVDIANEDKIDKSNLLHNDEGVDLLPSNLRLSALENQIIPLLGRESLLKGFIEQVKSDYDYILVDCSPTLNIISINAFTAADSVLIPTQPSYLAVQGLQDLLKTVSQVKRQLNPKLSISGILITMYDSRTNYSKEVIDILRENYDELIFNTVIPRSIKQEEASTDGKSIYSYAKNNKVAFASKNLIEEVK